MFVFSSVPVGPPPIARPVPPAADVAPTDRAAADKYSFQVGAARPPVGAGVGTFKMTEKSGSAAADFCCLGRLFTSSNRSTATIKANA
jgi:hypothetical protein